MFNDKNYAYLLFLKPILSEMQRVNKCFQSGNTNGTELLNDMTLAIHSLKKGIVPPDIDVDLLETEDVERYVHDDLAQGYEFKKHVKLMKLDPLSEKEIRDCCSKFLVELIKQLKQRKL
ncbi:uncharacterized protein LOC133848406 [Drosophila sulfurigaster albostrigata]|uniref:uncharacterized protein LOC133848406 n=1 Tax=Drosophila sulfurigaster albostrigata TaxID=89887 RepID=UPI002D21DDCD|nr:uncharacterized protein LOC133848406 [Drosophila sulfurigaster albostrigata]